MIINADAKGLEWVGGTYLSQDKVAFDEIWAGVDQHTLNQEAFGLPSRLIAKTFVFRLMYGGSAYSYANDTNFTDVSNKEKFWQEVIDAFYNKYKGMAQWHKAIIKEAVMNKQLVMPTGRICRFELKPNWRGDLVAPETIIKNYPVQGLGADIMSVIRVEFARLFKKEKVKGVLINTVHDSIVCDTENSELQLVNNLFLDVFKRGPELFEKRFHVKFNLPLQCEVGYGNNMKELTTLE